MKPIISFFAIIILMLLPSSCGKMPINGALDANWQITSIHYDDGETSTPEGTLYICISLHTFQLRGAGLHSANMVYDEKAGIINLDFPLSQAPQLRTWGFGSTKTSAKIIKLNHKELVLLTDCAEITCRRF